MVMRKDFKAMKNTYKHIAEKEDELLKCLKCGTCLSEKNQLLFELQILCGRLSQRGKVRRSDLMRQS